MKKFSYLMVLVTLIAVIGSSCVSSRNSNGCPTTNKNFFKGR
ncbi:MAG: hypothetical protein ABL870_04420 [Sediminibacterium sp.]